MRLLILGGTVFVGRHLAEAAHARGHEVTLFHRGTRPDVLPELEHVHGDRDGGLDALGDRAWDAAIDTSGYLPRLVRDSVRALAERVGTYAFVSTISVYLDATRPHLTEEARLATLRDPRTETIDEGTYGGLKALCEDAVRALGRQRTLIVRPGLVVGPHDPTDRFTYWVRRLSEDGPVLVPDAASQPLQWIDARDLAAFVVGALEDGVTGTYNAVVPPDGHTFGDLLDACTGVAGTDPERVAVPESFLLERGVRPFADLPLWLPGDDANLFRVSAERATRAGLLTQALSDSVADVLIWDAARRPGELQVGLPRRRELDLIDAWRSRWEG